MKRNPNIPNLWQELAAIVMRKQRPSALVAAGYPVADRFPLANGPVSSILIPLVLVGLFGDVPLSLVIVALCHPGHPMLIHVSVAAIGLLTLGWAIAARSALRAIPHVVSSDALWIGGGIRLSGVIPKAAIESVQAIRVSRYEWMSERGVESAQVVLASGFDPPNLAVEIKETASEMVSIFSRNKHTPGGRWVLLYADNPSALLRAASTPSAV